MREKREPKILLHLTPTEHKIIKEASYISRKPMSAFLRELGLKKAKEIVEAIEKDKRWK